MNSGDGQFQELWVHSDDGQMLCALINGPVGWVSYLRWDGDPGFSSRNPEYAGPPDGKIEYRLSNGQVDEYPAARALPLDVVQRALRYFEQHGRPPPFVHWHNDSGDGVVLGS